RFTISHILSFCKFKNKKPPTLLAVFVVENYYWSYSNRSPFKYGSARRVKVTLLASRTALGSNSILHHSVQGKSSTEMTSFLSRCGSRSLTQFRAKYGINVHRINAGSTQKPAPS